MSLVDSTSNSLKESATKTVGDSASKAVTGVVSNTVSGASNAVSGVEKAVTGAVAGVLTNVAVGAAVGAVSGTVAKTLTKVAVGAVAGAVAGAAVSAVSGAVASVLSDSTAKATESASATKFTLEIPGSGLDTSVVDFSAHEEMSEPFAVNVKLACDDKVPFDKVLGSEAIITITSGSTEPPRYFHGVISKFKRAGSQGKYLYEASILPYLALLSMSTDCRIFQNMTVVEIVKEVLNAYKHFLGTDRYTFLALKGNGDKVKRVYCVQYRETDLDFISRILAEEGIFYYFEHSKEKHVIVFGDNIMNYKEIPGTTTIAFNSSSGMNTGTDSVQSFDFSHQLTPGKVAHRSYNYENSSVKLKTDKEEKNIFNFEVYDHSVHIQDEAGGSAFSKTHLESLKTFEAQAEADSICPRLSAGYIFSMDKGKPDAQYLVTSISHIGAQPQVLEENANDGKTTYTNIFISIPAKTSYRPSLISKPVIQGLQSAVVVGPKGEEIHTDDHGRVRVQFHWDRQGKMDENSSCWLRVAQSWGGGARGAQYIPRIGDEVMVSFLEGDPDRPFVTSSTYNSDNTPINALKGNPSQSGFRTKTHKGSGFHELRFDDANGKEEIFMHSQKDFNIEVKDRWGQTIGGDSGTEIGRHCDQFVGGSHYTEVKGDLTELVHQKIVLGSNSQITIVCGGSSIVINAEGIKINAPRIDLNDGSSAPMPAAKEVVGNQGKGGGGAKQGGGASKGGGSPAPKPAAKPAPQPEPTKPDDWKVGPLKDRELEPNEHLIYADGTEAPSSVWGKGDLGTDVAMHMPDPSTLKDAGLSKAGDLVSSASSSIPASLQNTIKNASSALDNTKGMFLEKASIGDIQNKMAKLSGKPASILGNTKINPNDVIKTF